MRLQGLRTESIKGLLRLERFPHIWCPGCGVGVVVKCYVEAVLRSGIPIDRHVVVSGIGCTSRAPGYIRLDGFHVIHGRAIPFAVGLKTVRQDLEVTIIAGDGDILAIGGNHFLHAARRNDDVNVILVNNLIYGMTGGQYAPTTTPGSITSTSPYGFLEGSFNVPYLAAALGANFVARWTPLHAKELTAAIMEAFRVDGFTVIEVISPCLVYSDLNNIPPLEVMKAFRGRAVIDHDADLSKVDVDLKDSGKPIVLGNFVRRRRPSHQALARGLIGRVKDGG